jgi:taurine dioxygenase
VTIDVHPLQDDLSFGARVRGITFDALEDPATRRELSELFEARGVVVFEDVEPSSQMQVAISDVFGPLKDHPVPSVERVDAEQFPGVIVIRNNPTAGTLVEIDGELLATWQPWHFDHSYNNELNRAGVLRAETITPTKGLTAFVDGVQLYRDLDPALRAEIEDRELLYGLDLRFAQQRYGLPEGFRLLRDKTGATGEQPADRPLAVHPAVWTRESGERVLHLSPYGGQGVVGMDDAEADELLRTVWAEVERVMQPYFHQWKPTDMLIWDNWRMLHQACGCDPDDDRVMHRTTIKGDYGFGRWQAAPGAVSV